MYGIFHGMYYVTLSFDHQAHHTVDVSGEHFESVIYCDRRSVAPVASQNTGRSGSKLRSFEPPSTQKVAEIILEVHRSNAV
jgi:hypothetical protein